MQSNEQKPLAHPLEAITRWENGHHLFFVLIQALIVVHRRFEQAARKDDWQAASDALTDATAEQSLDSGRPRGEGALRRPRVRDQHPAERAAVRGAEPREAGPPL